MPTRDRLKTFRPVNADIFKTRCNQEAIFPGAASLHLMLYFGACLAG
jgi:hypothetical protein